jgi:hypothetical protein
MPRAWLILMLLTATSRAIAGSRSSSDALIETYQVFVGDADTKDLRVRGFELPKGGYYTHALLGDGGTHNPRLVLMTCTTKQCTGTTQWLGESSATIDSLILIDLNGTAITKLVGTRIDTTTGRYQKLAWSNAVSSSHSHAVLAVTTKREQVTQAESRFGGKVSGTERRNTFLLVDVQSNRGGSLFSGTTEDRGATGAGTTTSYSLDCDKKATTLDLIAVEQRWPENRSMCLPGKPVSVRYGLKDNRYQVIGDRLWPGGC